MRLRTGTATRRLMSRLVRAALMMVILVGFHGRVGAKGPESATIRGPGIDQPLELIDDTNPDLVAKLMEQTGLWYGTGDLPRPVDEPQGKLGPAHTLTWVNSGPPGKSVAERTIYQEIYLNAKNGPLIHTPQQANLQGWGPGVVGWFAAPGGLRETLVELGVPVSTGSSFSLAALFENAAGAPGYLDLAGIALLAGLAGTLGVYALKRRT